MAVKDLVFRILGEDSVSPVFKKVAAEAETSAASVSASYKEAGASMDKSLATASTAGAGGFKKIAAGATAASLVVVGAVAVIGVKAVHMAADFQTSITRLATSAGESKKNLGMVSQGILDMTAKTSTSAQDLAKGMYTVESAGYHGAAGLAVLKSSAQGAAIEGADLTEVTNAVTTAMTDYQLKGAKGAAQATNTLLAAVSRGKTTFGDLAASMPTILPIASQLGLSFQETAGAMATMTGEGYPAAKAATYLKQTLGNLASGGTAIAQKTFEQLGLSATHVSQELGNRGLAATVQTISTALKDHLTPAGLEAMQSFEKSGGSAKAYKSLMGSMSPPLQTTFGMLAKMSGGVKGLSGFLSLSGPHLKTFRANTEGISKAVDEGGKHIEGWSDYQKTMNAQVEEAKVSIEALAIGIGTDLLPYVQKFIGYVVEATEFLAKHKTEVEIVAVALGTLAIGWLLVAGAIALVASPVLLTVLAVAALASGLAIAYEDSKTFRDIVNQAFTDVKVVVSDVVQVATRLWRTFGGTIMSVAKEMLSGVISIFKGEFEIVAGIFKFYKDLFTGNWSALWGDIKDILRGAWDVIKGILKVALGLVSLQMRLAWDAIKGVVASAWTGIKSLVSSGASDIVSAVKAIPGQIKDAAGALFHSAGGWLIGQFVSGMKNAGGIIEGIAGNVWNAVRSLMNGAIDTINRDLEFTIPIPLGPDIHVNPPDIPHLAKGGYITRPTLALIGEAGPEWVIPERDMVNVSRGGGRRSGDDQQAQRQVPTVNIEHYHEAGLTSEQVAMDILFLAA